MSYARAVEIDRKEGRVLIQIGRAQKHEYIYLWPWALAGRSLHRKGSCGSSSHWVVWIGDGLYVRE